MPLSSSTPSRQVLSRVYPKGTRIESSNPPDLLACKLWDAGVQVLPPSPPPPMSASAHQAPPPFQAPQGVPVGAHTAPLPLSPSPPSTPPPPPSLSSPLAALQMVALNAQTHDGAMMASEAMFRLNGGCGYVLKPPLVEKASLAPPEAPSPDEQDRPRMLKLRILSAHNLPKTRARQWSKGLAWPITSERPPEPPWPSVEPPSLRPTAIPGTMQARRAVRAATVGCLPPSVRVRSVAAHSGRRHLAVG